MPVLTPAQGRSGRAGGLAGAGKRSEGRGRFAVEREVGRQGGGHRRGVEKNEQTSSERWRGGGELPRNVPVRTLSSFPFFLSSSPLFLFSFSSSLSLSGCHSFSTVPQFRFTMHRRLQRRTSYSPNDFLLTSKYEARPREVFSFFSPFLPLFLREAYFENAHVYNKGSLRSMR